MTSEELYYEFHLLANKNNENANINIEIPNFVILFNRESKKWLADKLNKFNSSDDIFNLQELLVSEKKLVPIESEKSKVTYSLPADYFSIVYGDNYSICEKGSCSKKVYNYFPKPNDLNYSLEDSFKKPDFDWERSLATINDNKLKVYKGEDYKVNDTFVSYYKYPKEIDIKGYTKLNGEKSKEVNPTLSETYLQDILNKVVTEITRQFNNPQDLQIALERENH
jgi:hypothetical protein